MFTRSFSQTSVLLLSFGIFAAVPVPVSANPGIQLHSEPNFKGEVTTIDVNRLADKACVDIDQDITVKSINLSNDLVFQHSCCVLYRSPCTPSHGLSQGPYFLNQRVFSDISDLTPYGWTDTIRSIVCPGHHVCAGFMHELDEVEVDGETESLRNYWVDTEHAFGANMVFV
ncbi:hypothetical protein QBC47DRAFT_42718 [Echria macrotheca]|uniref:Rieske domain-containing protein n=1 Tax=Echria macrotheca TaxID=438768 RepID=A0AAJ0B834_9PEZI|nr:hypothetical protein QBC47DRAFT_42718 [Echria macrotheca]